MIPSIYKLIFLLLHAMAFLYETLRWLGLRLQAAMLWSYDSLHKNENRDRNILEECMQYLTKLPKHINIIVGSKDAQVNEELLSLIIKYALIANINCVSFYDTRQPNSGQIQLNKLRPPKGYHSKQISDRHISWRNTATRPVNVKCGKGINGVCNGASTTITNGTVNGGGSTVEQLQHKPTDNTVQIYEITSRQGRPLIAEACLALRRKNVYATGLSKTRLELTECINNELTELLDGMPELDLSIIFSNYTCTFGMLPWQTRFTEFYTHECGRSFNVYTFVNILCKYSGCEQRWGT